MSDKPLVLVDADVLGRRRTGDETYVMQLLRELPNVADDLRIAAVTRDPALVPDGVEAIHLPARSQELRMAVTVPRLLRRLRPAVAHFIHALPLSCPVPAVVTVQDLSWERDPERLRLLGSRDLQGLRPPRRAQGGSRARDLGTHEERSHRALRHAREQGDGHTARARSGVPPRK